MNTKVIQFDLEHLRMITGDDREFMIEIMEMIQAESPEVVREIKGYLGRGEFEPLAKAAHKYKSSINILGNAEMIHLMKDIELRSLAAKDAAEVMPMIDQFEDQVGGLLQWLQGALTELRAAA
jgi:HPt (histidine-containing phosphotransfer) domain-containing protein